MGERHIPLFRGIREVFTLTLLYVQTGLWRLAQIAYIVHSFKIILLLGVFLQSMQHHHMALGAFLVVVRYDYEHMPTN